MSTPRFSSFLGLEAASAPKLPPEQSQPRQSLGPQPTAKIGNRPLQPVFFDSSTPW